MKNNFIKTILILITLFFLAFKAYAWIVVQISFIIENNINENYFTSEPTLPFMSSVVFGLLVSILFFCLYTIWRNSRWIIAIILNLIITLFFLLLRFLQLKHSYTSGVDYDMNDIGINYVLITSVLLLLPINYFLNKRVINKGE